jgi:hypothetical protein
LNPVLVYNSDRVTVKPIKMGMVKPVSSATGARTWPTRS